MGTRKPSIHAGVPVFPLVPVKSTGGEAREARGTASMTRMRQRSGLAAPLSGGCAVAPALRVLLGACPHGFILARHCVSGPAVEMLTVELTHVGQRCTGPSWAFLLRVVASVRPECLGTHLRGLSCAPCPGKVPPIFETLPPNVPPYAPGMCHTAPDLSALCATGFQRGNEKSRKALDRSGFECGAPDRNRTCI